MNELKEVCHQVGEWATDSETGKGAIILASGMLAALFTGWRFLRRRKPDRTLIRVDAPPGERVRVDVGYDSDESNA